MLFNSFDFLVFLILVFVVFWSLKDKKGLQNLVILISSYLFYSWWDYRFLTLIFASTLVDFFIAKKIDSCQNKKRKKLFLWISIGFNIGLLLYFKYFNFFIDSFSQLVTFFGAKPNISTLEIILPAGISFYTFQTLSYTIDVYKNENKATSNFIEFAAFVSFFPQLVAGPIERSTHLLPQFSQTKKFNYTESIDGLRQILWGLFKKVVIADSCAEYVNLIFNNSDLYPGSSLYLGGVLFAFQIYGDFSGYSDIAIGTARLFGFDLMQNFSYPYFSRDIAEFWRRWHISLTTWFRDYIYIPLGGSRGSNYEKVRNVFIVFLISGFWHGANWTFVIWGILNAIYFLPLILKGNNRRNLTTVANGAVLPSINEFFQILWTFLLVVIAWIIFRSDDLNHAVSIFCEIFSSSFFSSPFILEAETGMHILPKKVLVILMIFIGIEWRGRHRDFAIEHLFKKSNFLIRYIFYYVLMISIYWFSGGEQQFIYFQF